MFEKESKSIYLESDNLSVIFGTWDSYLKKLERAFDVTIVQRGGEIKVLGASDGIEKTVKVLKILEEIANNKSEIDEQKVNYLISSADDTELRGVADLNKDYICMTMLGKKIVPKTIGQKKYVDAIRKNTVVLGIGPAGTGKTYLAMAMAISAFKANEVNRIILTRPAIEAGEKLGFLPGDLQQKVDPYLRPLYDALHEIMGADTFAKNMEKGLIEVAPLAYMRGRTLDNCFIVLDEAQNTTPEQMKMFLTRIGFGSKTVITGDVTQVDLPDGKRSGLVEAAAVLAGIEGIGISYLTNKDVVRHPLVQKIIEAYEKHDKNGKNKKPSIKKPAYRGYVSRRK